MKILVMHGPSLNLLGTREPAVYGTRTLAQIDALIVSSTAAERGESKSPRTRRTTRAASSTASMPPWSRDSSAIVSQPRRIHAHQHGHRGRDPRGEDPGGRVHLSNLFARGPERSKSVTASAGRGLISGFGHESYHAQGWMRRCGPAQPARPRAHARQQIPLDAGREKSHPLRSLDDPVHKEILLMRRYFLAALCAALALSACEGARNNTSWSHRKEGTAIVPPLRRTPPRRRPNQGSADSAPADSSQHKH